MGIDTAKARRRSGRRSRTAGSSSSSRSSSTCTGARAPSSSRRRTSTGSSRTVPGFAGLRGRRDRPAAERSRHRGDPRPRQLHARAVAAEPGALRLRRDRRGRGVAVLPAHDPAQRRSPRRRRRATSSRSGSSSSTSSSQLQRRRHDRDRRQARHAREAVLRHGGPDAAVRLPDHGLAVLQRARLGQLRERPRGRERPVRAELRVRRRARHAATARSSSATWCTRSPSSTGGSRRSCRSRSRR